MPAKKGSSAPKVKRVSFKFSAPEAGEVCLAGDFNGWDPQKKALTKNAKGEWTGYVNLQPGTYQYRYVVDSQWVSDMSADTVYNEFGELNNVRSV